MIFLVETWQVYYFLFEGTPPRIPGVKNPEAHFEALTDGHRPAFTKTRATHKRIINLCWATSSIERPTAKELVALVNASLKRTSCAGLCAETLTLEEKEAAEEAEAVFAEIEKRIVKKRRDSGSSLAGGSSSKKGTNC